MTRTSRQSPKRLSLLIGVIALILASIYAIQVLADADWDATVFVGLGEDAEEIRAYAEDRLGPVQLRPQLGHDGRFFFVQANDPWILSPEDNAYILDRPLYRSQRMFYPSLAGGFGTFGPEAIVWAMLLVNLVAMGFGAWAVAEIAVVIGRSTWWGLAFPLNLGFISELGVGGAGIVAGAAAFGALALLMKGNTWAAVVLLTVAALSREVMLVVAAGAAFYLWRREEKGRARVVVGMPLGAVVGWAFYLRLRMGFDSGLAELQEVGIPFVGLVDAFESWVNDPLDLIVGVTVLLVLGLFVVRAILHDNLIAWAFIGFVPLTMMLTEQVWHSYFDITRAVAPVLTAFVLLVVLENRVQPQHASGLGSTKHAGRS